MGEADILSMTELIKSRRHFLYWGLEISEDGGWGGGIVAGSTERAGGWKQQVSNVSAVLLQSSGWEGSVN